MSEAVLKNDDEVTEDTGLDEALGAAIDALDQPEESAGETVETGDDSTDETDESSSTPDDSETPAEETEDTDEPEKTDEPETPEPKLVDGKDITQPPTSWKPEAAAEFAKLPESVRAEIHKREEDFHKGIEQYRGAAQWGQEVANVFKPYARMLEQTKIVPTHLIGAALRFETEMRSPETDKAGLLTRLGEAYGLSSADMLKHLAQQHGVELEGVEIKDAPKDERYAALEQKLNGVETKIQERERLEREAQEKSANEEREKRLAEVNAFAADPANEFYGLVKDDMLKIIQSGQGADLRDAYDKAIWINPVSRAKLIARQQEAEQRKAAEKAAAAKKANGTNVKPRATPPARTSGKGTLDEALNAALDGLN